VQDAGGRQTADKRAAQLPEAGWTPVSRGVGAQGERVHSRACLLLSETCPPGTRRWLLMRRSPDDPAAIAWYLACGREVTPMGDLVPVCDARWQVEECCAQAEGEGGMDPYAVRTWTAWHRFVTRCRVAHALRVVLRAQAMPHPRGDAERGARGRLMAGDSGGVGEVGDGTATGPAGV
jgi:hypothetical protein